MSRRKNESILKNPLLRRTLQGLLLAAPVLPLGGCDFNSTEPCARGPFVMDSTQAYSPEMGDTPPCGGCPDHPEGMRVTNCSAFRETESRTLIRCYYASCLYDGRRPEGLAEARDAEACCEVGALYAHVAWLEAASVPAFLRLAEELAAHGAPAEVVKAARRSAGDEVRHTRAMQALALRHGARMPEVELEPFQHRTLEAMCLENAIEGCVREMFGALVTGWQARTAADAEVRRVLEPIAQDELRHAELAWAVDAWASERLSADEVERLRRVRRETLSQLERDVSAQTPPERLVREAGVPTREQALRLLQGMSALLA